MSGTGRARWLPVLLCVLLPLSGLAQAPVTPPPLVPVPSTPQPAPSESTRGDPYGGYEGEEEEPEEEEDAPRGELFPREPKSPSQGRGARIAAGALLGLLGEAALGTPGGSLLILLVLYENFDPAIGIPALSLTFLGVSVGAALGVTGGGALFGGQGQFRAVLGGAALGTVAGGLLAIPAAFAFEGGWVLPLLAGPVTGAIIAYEWSHGRELERKAARANVQVMPLLGVSRSGGLVAGLAGSF